MIRFLINSTSGGILLSGVVLLCIELGIRPPNGALLVYSPTIMASAISVGYQRSRADATCCVLIMYSLLFMSLCPLAFKIIEFGGPVDTLSGTGGNNLI